MFETFNIINMSFDPTCDCIVIIKLLKNYMYNIIYLTNFHT